MSTAFVRKGMLRAAWSPFSWPKVRYSSLTLPSGFGKLMLKVRTFAPSVGFLN